MNSMPKPHSETSDTVTLSKAELNAYLEDLRDNAALDRSLAVQAALGDAEYKRLCYTQAEVSRILDDNVSVVTIWRDRERLTQRALAEKAGISVTYLSEIEAGKKPARATALKALAAVLRVPVEHLVG